MGEDLSVGKDGERTSLVLDARGLEVLDEVEEILIGHGTLSGGVGGCLDGFGVGGSLIVDARTLQVHKRNTVRDLKGLDKKAATVQECTSLLSSNLRCLHHITIPIRRVSSSSSTPQGNGMVWSSED